MREHIFRPRNRLGKYRRERPRSCGNALGRAVFALARARNARAYIVSARDRPNLIAYWEEILVKHECACIANVDGGQLCHPAKACPAEAVSPGADAGAPVSLQPGLRRLRQDSVPGPCPQAPADPRGVLPGGR